MFGYIHTVTVRIYCDLGVDNKMCLGGEGKGLIKIYIFIMIELLWMWLYDQLQIYIDIYKLL